MISIKTILHPTDFSQTARQASYVAQLLARDHGAKLIVLHVCSPQGAESPEYAQEQITSLAQSIPNLPVETYVVSGKPGEEIVAATSKWNADLIVMGTHGRSGSDRMLIGSVAEHVVRNAPCAVLTLKPGAGWGLTQEQEESLPLERPVIVT